MPRQPGEASPGPRFRLRTTDVLPSTADVVVVGAGVVGCATAFRAARAGYRTVVLDARPRPATLTTPAATGAFRLQFDNPEEMALVREGIELYEDFAERAGLPGYDLGLGHNGYLFCARDAETVGRQRASGLRVVGGRVVAVETHDGAVAAPIVVLATGPFLGRTAALAGVEVPIAPTRRQKVVIPDAPEVPPEAPMTIDEETGAHWRPALRGAFVLLTEPNTPAGDPVWSVPTSADYAFRLLDPASPDSVAVVAPFWADVWDRGANWVIQAGQYEYSPDHRPFVGPTPVDGLWLNGGWSGHGVMGTGGGSRILLDAIAGTSTGPSWGLRTDGPGGNPFRLDRPMDVGRHDVL
jgi:sarcosine oxidase subunit beta